MHIRRLSHYLKISWHLRTMAGLYFSQALRVLSRSFRMQRSVGCLFPDVHFYSSLTVSRFVEGYTKDVLAYVKQHGEAVLQRHNEDLAKAAAGGSEASQSSSSLQSGVASAASKAAGLSAGDPVTNDGQTALEGSNESPQAPSAPPLRLTIRGGPDQKVLLAIPPTKTVLSVIKAFLRKFKIDQDRAGQCKLLFDGEEMDHETQLKDTDVEDEDTLDVKVPAA